MLLKITIIQLEKLIIEPVSTIPEAFWAGK